MSSGSRRGRLPDHLVVALVMAGIFAAAGAILWLLSRQG